MRKKLFLMLPLLLAVTVVSSCDKQPIDPIDPPVDEVLVASVGLNERSLTLDVGATAKLIAEVLPSNATEKSVEWTSSDSDKVMVDSSGKIVAVAVGAATITAEAGGKSATCNVTVVAVKVPVESIALNQTTQTLQVDDTLMLSAEVLPSNATVRTVEWSSSAPLVASVDDAGLVTALAVGDAVIVAEADGVRGECILKVVGRTETSGKAGPLDWVFTEDRTLIISGNGAMPDYTNTEDPAKPREINSPWFGLRFNNVIIEEGVTSIGNFAFAQCQGFLTISMPNSLTNIGEHAFWGCAFEEITFPAGLRTMGNAVLVECVSLERVVLPEGLEAIPPSAFYWCTSLREVNFPDSITAIGQWAFHLTLISEATFKNVGFVGQGAFFNCEQLTEVHFLDKLTTIEQGAFQDCTALKTVSLPATLEVLWENNFYGCTAIESITCHRPSPTLPFVRVGFGWESTSKAVTLRVPAGSEDAYRNDAKWGAAFTTITAIQ